MDVLCFGNNLENLFSDKPFKHQFCFISRQKNDLVLSPVKTINSPVADMLRP